MDDPANKDNDVLEVRQPLNLLTLILKDWTAYLGSIAAVLAGVAGVWAGLGVVIDDSVRVWSTIAITVIPPSVVYVFVTGPKRAMARRFHRLRDSTVRARDDFFRLTLWDQGDYTNFRRADKRHSHIYKWLLQHVQPGGESILFVDGLSGTGKSSLLVNYVAPRAEAEAGYSVLTIRASTNPLEQVTANLKQFWKQPPRDCESWSLRAWFENAGKRDGAPPAFVLFIDQGEELLRLKGEGDAPHPLIVFLKEHRSQPIPWLRVVISTRTEYVGEFEKLGLHTDARQRITVFAFDEGAAQSFMAQGLENEEDVLQLVQIGSALDGLAGLVRPITLNMLGTIYRRDVELRADLRAARADGVGVFEGYIQRRIQADDMRELGPAVLRHLVTRSGRRESPIEQTTIHKRLACDSRALSACLERLATDGLVRALSPAWEVAHDFLASPMNSVLQRLEHRLWHKVRPYMVPTLAVLWFTLLGGFAVRHYVVLPAQAQVEITSHGIEMEEVCGGWSLRFPHQWTGDLGSLMRHMHRLRRPVVALDLTETRVTDLSPLKELTALESLVLSEILVTDFSPLKELTGLESLVLSETLVTDLSPLKELTGLTSLDLSSNWQLSDLSPLKKLTGLTSLDLSGNWQVSDLSPLKELTGLTSLNLDSTAVIDLSPLRELTGLTSLSLSYTEVSDLSPLKELTGLTSLKLFLTTRVSLTEIKELRKALPGCRINQ